MNLADYLVSEKVTQSEFGRRVGVTQGMVWQWVSGTRPIAAEKVLPIERATGGKVSRHDLRPDIYPRETRRLAASV